jgi:hypothetical protein
MKYEVVLNISTKDPDEFYKVAAIEAGVKDRSGIYIEKGNKEVIFKISSADSTALKASLNLVQKIITIYEKTEALVEENGRRKGNRAEDCPASNV